MPGPIDRGSPRPVTSPASGTTAPAAPAAAEVPRVVGRPDDFAPGTAGAPHTVQTVFTPGSAALELEHQALDSVIAARKADARTYRAAENPYRIEYAIYNMTDRSVISKLIEAARAGVYVQVLIDADQIGPHKPHNTVVNDLKAGGFSHAESQKGLSADDRVAKNIVEIDLLGSGLFHFKSRYFRYLDPATGKTEEVLLTGSHNPQSSAQKNDESLHRIEDPRLIKKYVDAFHAVRDDQPITNAWDDGEATNVLFTSAATRGPKPVDKIFDLIDQERELIFITVFALRNLEASDGRRLVDALGAAKARGVPVIVVSDRKQTDGIDPSWAPGKKSHSVKDTIDEELEARGIPVFELMNLSGPFTAMHLKSAVFGLNDIKVVTDTGNWTQATMGSGGTSRGKNAESLLFIDSGKHDENKTGMTYLAEFMRVMRRYADQDQGSPKPDIEKTIASLQELPAWPKVKVDLQLLGRAHDGREVYVTGDRPELKGAPGEPGLRLATDPVTSAVGTPASLELPLGLKLEYRVVEGRSGAPSGKPSIVVVDPPVGSDPRHVTVEDATSR